MLITHIKLLNYKRFPLSDEEEFIKDFNSKLTMIAGVNGSGKSSLFNELTPLPSDKLDYSNGYKEIHISHNRDRYILISDFRDSAKYRFICNDIELNKSSNITTQRDLVYSHFKLTPSIHDLLIGREVFTDLPLLARKKLFSAISSMDIDKVLEYYASMKEEHKLLEHQLKQEYIHVQTQESKLLDTEHVSKLKADKILIEKFINDLLTIRSYVSRYIDTDTISIESYKASLDNYKSILKKYSYYLSTYDPTTNYETTIVEDIASSNTILKTYYRELEELLKDRDTHINCTNYNTTDIDTELDRIKNESTNIVNSLQIYKDASIDTTRVRQEIYKLEATLSDILLNLSTNPIVNSKRMYSNSRVQELISSREDIHQSLSKHTKELNDIDTLLKHLETKSNHTTCPVCKHTYSTLTSYTYEELNSKRISTLSTIENYKLKLSSLTLDIDRVSTYLSNYNTYSKTISSSTDTEPILAIINSRDLLYTHPSSITQLFTLALLDLSFIDRVKELKDKSILLLKRKEEILSLGTTTYETLEAKHIQLNYGIRTEQSRNLHLKYKLSHLRATKTLYSKILELSKSVSLKYKQLQATHLSMLVTDIISVIDKELAINKVSLIEIDRELTLFNSIEYTINTHRERIATLESKLSVVRAITDSLCPKNGLIAKTVSSFLNTIIANINSTISSIWNYKLSLLTINVDTDPLNYKFKVCVEDKIIIDDIDRVSKGMKEVINLSFKIVLYKLLKLENYPLYLDELAANLDSNHTSNMIGLVHRLSTSEYYSQIFLISHKENFNFLKNLDVVNL